MSKNINPNILLLKKNQLMVRYAFANAVLHYRGCVVTWYKLCF